MGQRSTDIPALLQVALDRFGRSAHAVADRWRDAELRNALEKAGITPTAFETRGMGFADVRAFRWACAGDASRRRRRSCSGPQWRRLGQSLTRPAKQS